VLVANAVYLLGIGDPNPLATRSNLATGMQPGPLPGLPTIDPNNGFISQAMSHRAALDLLRLQLPWWDPYEGLGAPLAAELQNASLFPFTLLTFFANGQIYEHMLFELLAGWGTFLVLQKVRLSWLASAAGGAAFALNGTFAWFSHAPVNPIFLLPLVILGMERSRDAALGQRRGGFGLLALTGALSFYAGFPEVTLIDTLLALVWAGWRLSSCDPPTRLRFIRKLAAGGTIAALLSAPLLIAWLDYLPLANLGAHSGGGFGSAHLPSFSVPGILFPYVFGPIFAYSQSPPPGGVSIWWGSIGGYLATAACLLALLALLDPRYRALKLLLGLWIALVLSRTYGVAFLHGVFGVIPGIDHVAFYRYSWPSLSFAVIVLAAYGIHFLSTTAPRLRTLVAAGVVALAATIVAAQVARRTVNTLGVDYAAHHFYRYSVLWGIGMVLLILLVAAVPRPSARAGALATLLILDALVMFVVPELSAPRRLTVDVRPVRFLEDHLHGQRFFTLGPFGPNYGSYYGLSELDVNDVPVPNAFAGYVTHRLAPLASPLIFIGAINGPGAPPTPTPAQQLVTDVRGYRAAAVSYVLAPPGLGLPAAAGFRLALRTPTTWIYRLLGAEGYFTPSSGCAARWLSPESAQTVCTQPGRLVKRELEMPGWHANVDGVPVPVHATKLGFQSIPLPAGRHTVLFHFSPPYEGFGAAALLLGAAGLFGPELARTRRIRTAYTWFCSRRPGSVPSDAAREPR
jgi:hypothetical protein